MDHWITHLGCPDSLHSDLGRNFEANFFTSLTKLLLQLDETRTIAFHSQFNPVIGRTNRTQLNMLVERTHKNQRKWSELRFCVMLAYRTSVHESTDQQATRFTSYFLAMRRPSRQSSNCPRHVMLPGRTITSMLLRHESGSTQPTNRLVSTCKFSGNVNMRFITIMCMPPKTAIAKWFSSIIPQLSKDSVLSFILFGTVHTKSHKSSVK